jgi:hypothetical protein
MVSDSWVMVILHLNQVGPRMSRPCVCPACAERAQGFRDQVLDR